LSILLTIELSAQDSGNRRSIMGHRFKTNDHDKHQSPGNAGQANVIYDNRNPIFGMDYPDVDQSSQYCWHGLAAGSAKAN
jgi:hypothetical protein